MLRRTFFKLVGILPFASLFGIGSTTEAAKKDNSFSTRSTLGQSKAPKVIFSKDGVKYKIMLVVGFNYRDWKCRNKLLFWGTVYRWTDDPDEYRKKVIYPGADYPYADRPCWLGIKYGEILDDVAEHMPDLAEATEWNDWSARGHNYREHDYYIENTLYHVGNRDSVGKYKRRNFDRARKSAKWPTSTDAELMKDPGELKKILEARRPEVMAEFRRVIESIGFIW